MSPQSSGLKNKPREKPALNRQQTEPMRAMLFAFFLLLSEVLCHQVEF
jgi:hypothetical protein